MSSIYDLPLPSAPEAERLILGSLLAGSAPIENITGVLAIEDFSLEKHRRIYAVLMELAQSGTAVNRVTLAQALMAAKQLESVDGLSYLAQLETDSLPVNQDSYVQLVKDKAIYRQTIVACNLVTQRCYAAAASESGEVVLEAEAMLAKIGEGAKSKIALRQPKEIMDAYPGGSGEFLNRKKKNGGIPTPWPSLNKILGGFRSRQLVIVAARTSVGKSVAAAQIALWTAQLGHATAVFSMEMPGDDILTRMICSKASVNSFHFQNGHLGREERQRFAIAASDVTKLPLWIDDSTACTLPAIQTAARKLKATKDLKIVVVDYLGLLESTGKSENRVQEVSALTRGLKRAAVVLGIPFIVLCQLSRASVTAGGEPELHHLRESGSIEQDADVVLFLHQQPNKEDPPPKVVETKFIVAKQRGGPVGRCSLQLLRDFTRFDDPDGKALMPDETEYLPYADE